LQERLGRQVSDQDEGKNVNENRLEEFPKDVQGIAPNFKEAVVNGKVIVYQFWESKSVPPPALDQSQDAVVFPGFSF